MKSLFIAVVYFIVLSLAGLFRSDDVQAYVPVKIELTYEYRMRFERSIQKNLKLQAQVMESIQNKKNENGTTDTGFHK